MKLYTYYRSSASYRVRIALHYKNLGFENHFINLSQGKQFDNEFFNINAQQLVPVLATENHTLSQSLAILEFLEELAPFPALLPKDKYERAHVRQIAQMIACEIQPFQNLATLKHLSQTFSVSEEQQLAWCQHWIQKGLAAVETTLASGEKTKNFCYGNSISLADVCLIPQISVAKRLNCDLSQFPTLLRINNTCNDLECFQLAAPNMQPDAIALNTHEQ